jgi:tRNA nucleotidyltransferase/poly(A) polymerase
VKKQVRFISGRHPLDDQSVQAAFALARERGIEMYLVGGCIRDAIETEAVAAKGAPAKSGPFDFDFAIKSNAPRICQRRGRPARRTLCCA